MCSIIGVRERLHKVLGQIDLGTLDSGERSLPFGLLNLKLATNDLNDKMFLLTSKFCPEGVVSPCPGAIYMYKIMKKYV